MAAITENLCGPTGLARTRLETKLRNANLRPTSQRMALANLMFAKGDRHFSAEKLYEEAKEINVGVSLATVYNTLHQFSEAGLLRTIAIDSSSTYFDTNTGNHHHFYVEGSDDLIDMPADVLRVENLPEPPAGMEVSQVDVIVRLKPV